jgi:hypothetical protein
MNNVFPYRQSQRPYTNAGFGEDLRRMHPDKLGELFPAFRRGKNTLLSEYQLNCIRLDSAPR